jgi:HNH endonuclease
MRDRAYRLPAVYMLPLGGRRGPFRGYAIIDLEDAPRVAGLAWYRDVLGYVVHGTWRGGRTEKMRLHRALMDPGSLEVDHINGDKLDHRRANLRIVSHGQNAQNVHTAKGRMRGVYRDARSGIYYGQVKHKGVRHDAGVRSRDPEVVRRAVVRLRGIILTHADPEARS